MTSSSIVPFQIQENKAFPKEWEKFWPLFMDFYQKISKSSNSKDIGLYEPIELLNGQKYYYPTPPADKNPNTKREVYRKVIECGILPNAGTTVIAHGIVGIGNTWMFTRIYGTAREPAGVAPRPYFIPIPNGGVTRPIEIMVDTTSINLTTTVNLSMFTYSIVILEYVKL